MGSQGSTTVVPKATEITLDCSDGIRLAAQSWKPWPQRTDTEVHENLHVLCLHGWMDNCRSFHWLAPALVSQLDASILEGDYQYSDDNNQNNGDSSSASCIKNYNVHVVALDLPGHGLSAHRGNDGPPTVRSEYIFYIAEAIRQLKWWTATRGAGSMSKSSTKFVLVGHSMSAGIALLYAAAFPEQVRQLIMLDSVGHLSRPVSGTSQHLRTYVQSRQRDGPFIMKHSNRFYYATLEAAVQARCRSASTFPGNQYISKEGARELVLRGIIEEEEVPQQATANHNPPSKPNKKFRFRHDQRLQWPSLQYFTEEQLAILYRDVQCPACVLLGEEGWPIEQEKRDLIREALQPAVFKTLPGSHHFHGDPDAADGVAAAIVHFLQSS